MFVVFEIQRFHSVYENEVCFNLSDSGNHPSSINDLLGKDEIEKFLSMEIYYGYTQGDPRLLNLIKDWYPNTNESNILLTSGSAEANFIMAWTLVKPGDEVVMVLPNYMQVPGLAKNFGAEIKTINLKEELGWRLDLNELEEIVTPNTKLISICNPNNPTGAVMTDEDMTSIASIARTTDAYVHSDEVYRA